MSDEHARMLEKHLMEVEGGMEVLYSRTLELDPYPDREKVTANWNPGRALPEEGALSPSGRFIRPGTGFLLPDFWDLPRPEDPEASVRRAVEEDRR